MKIKGFDKDLKCRGMQFEIGKTYDTCVPDDKIKLCSNTVFHYCDNIQQVHRYYACDQDNRYCEIEVLGAEASDSDKCGSNRIRIVREITGEELDMLLGRVNGNTGLFNTGDRNTGDRNTGNWNTGYWNTGNGNTGDRNTGNGNTGNWNTGNWNTGYWNTGNGNTGNGNTGDGNTGYWNTGMFCSCNYSSGVFCNVEQPIFVFNQPTSMTMREFIKSEYYGALNSSPFILTEWVNYSDAEMDTEEKKALGGYLKMYSYKEACKNWWDAMTEGNKAVIRSMPNFDAEVFYDITGIDVRDEAES